MTPRQHSTLGAAVPRKPCRSPYNSQLAMASSTPASPFQPTILAGKVALVTGGGSGIGLEITRQLGEVAAGCGQGTAVSERRTEQPKLQACPCELQGRTALSHMQVCMAPRL